MPSPFPGMDPYLERWDLWPDFHDGLITWIKAALVPLLRPRYVAFSQYRLVVMESERPIYPDLSILRTTSLQRPDGTGTAVLEADTPAVFDMAHEEIREPFIQIVEPAAGNRLVTAIEVLSPDNKEAGEGRLSYQRKRAEFWDAGVNLIEIDLLRLGEPTVRLSATQLESVRPFSYLVAVTRRRPPRHEVYAVPLPQRLPRIAIPLAEKDRDVVLDLQAAFTRCWDASSYPEALRYEGPPPGTLAPEELAWCESLLQAAGQRPTPEPKSKPKKRKS